MKEGTMRIEKYVIRLMGNKCDMYYDAQLIFKDKVILIEKVRLNKKGYILANIGRLVDVGVSSSILIFGDIDKIFDKDLQVVASKINRVKNELVRDIYKVKAYIVAKESKGRYEFEPVMFLDSVVMVYKLAYTVTGISRFIPNYIIVDRKQFDKLINTYGNDSSLTIQCNTVLGGYYDGKRLG